MKNFFLIISFCFFLTSCNNSKKHEGKWTNYFYTNYGYNGTRSLVITNDSVKFNYPYFDFWNKYPLKIEDKKFKFNDLALSVSIKKDTLTFNDSIHFVKNDLDTLYGYRPILKIDLPLIPDLTTLKKKNYITSYVYFGKRLDNGLFNLQLNDKYANITDLPEFLAGGCSGASGSRHKNFPMTVLSMDKNTPMNYVEEIFHEQKKINHLKVGLVSNIVLKYKDSLGLYYDYEILSKLLPYFRENDTYRPNGENIPPPPPPYYPMFDDENLVSKFISLKKDKLYFKNQPITTSELKHIIKPWVKNNNVVFSLYDLESSYGKFLEMNAIINSVYQEVRENQSRLMFNKPLEELNRKEYSEIKMKIKMHHIWSYSIPHFNHVVKQENTFFGLKVNKKM